MKKWFLYGILTFFTSCGQKFYTKKQYSFYDEKFILDKNSVLKTDGVYIIDEVWSSIDGIISIKPENRRIYKFYENGHSNFSFQDATQTEKSNFEYVKEQVAASNERKNTLFEGYYKIEGDKIVMQNMNVPRRMFNYSYGLIEPNKLIILRTGIIEGNGKFHDKFFTKYYVETYKFVNIENSDSLDKPNW